jgi:hypothetical protein
MTNDYKSLFFFRASEPFQASPKIRKTQKKQLECVVSAVVTRSLNCVEHVVPTRREETYGRVRTMQQELGERDHEAETLTKRFRREALQLCQNSNTPEAWQTAQHLLDRCWIDDDENDSSLNASNGTVASVYMCSECGATVHPGWEGTSLRVARLSLTKAARTRKRRLQRKQRRLLLSQQKQAKDDNRSNKYPPKSAESSSATKRFLLLREDTELVFDRHHLVVQCGRCQAKIRLKGLKREVPPTKQAIQRKQMGKGTLVSVNTMKRDDRKAGPRSANEDSLGDDNGRVDFLELPAPEPKRSTLNTLSAHRKPKPYPLTLQNPGKTKKKKNGDGNKNKGKLFSFLSSLND